MSRKFLVIFLIFLSVFMIGCEESSYLYKGNESTTRILVGLNEVRELNYSYNQYFGTSIVRAKKVGKEGLVPEETKLVLSKIPNFSFVDSFVIDGDCSIVRKSCNNEFAEYLPTNYKYLIDSIIVTIEEYDSKIDFDEFNSSLSKKFSLAEKVKNSNFESWYLINPHSIVFVNLNGGKYLISYYVTLNEDYDLNQLNLVELKSVIRKFMESYNKNYGEIESYIVFNNKSHLDTNSSNLKSSSTIATDKGKNNDVVVDTNTNLNLEFNSSFFNSTNISNVYNGSNNSSINENSSKNLSNSINFNNSVNFNVSNSSFQNGENNNSLNSTSVANLSVVANSTINSTIVESNTTLEINSSLINESLIPFSNILVNEIYYVVSEQKIYLDVSFENFNREDFNSDLLKLYFVQKDFSNLYLYKNYSLFFDEEVNNNLVDALISFNSEIFIGENALTFGLFYNNYTSIISLNDNIEEEGNIIYLYP